MRFKWGWCDQCDRAVIVCPKCGNESCSGVRGEVNGKPCDVCELCGQYEEVCEKLGIEPSRGRVRSRQEGCLSVTDTMPEGKTW